MNLLIINSHHMDAPLLHNNFLNNLNQRKIKDCYIDNNKFKNTIFQLNKLHENILTSFQNITIDEYYNKILVLPKDELSIYLYNQCHIKTDYDNNFLKFLINLNTKYKNNYEIMMLLRYLIDNVSTELCFKIIIYNALLKSIYCSYGVEELYERRDFQKYQRNYREYLNNLESEEKHFFIWHRYKRSEGLNPNNTVWPLISVLSYCSFFDLYQRDCFSTKTKFHEDEKLLKSVRKELKNKYIGEEKWKNQLALYKNTKFIFKDTDIKVLREYSPRFLGRQRFDVYFEVQNKKIAFEYQGEQHFKPVDFFGGINAYEKRKKLDKVKKEKCKRNSINLIEFNYTDSVSINSILEKLQKKNINLKGDNHVPNV